VIDSLAKREAELVRAEDHVARCTALLGQQMDLIHQLSTEGRDTGLARRILDTMTEVTQLMQMDVTRLKREIAAAARRELVTGPTD